MRLKKKEYFGSHYPVLTAVLVTALPISHIHASSVAWQANNAELNLVTKVVVK